jgi:hypothetical protein
MNKICTSLEQSKKLIKLGIDINTADMYRWYSGRRYYVESMDDDDFNEESDVPAWSLSALLELIPAGNILLRDALSKNYKCINSIDSNLYDNPLDAAFEMVVWLKENEKI